MLHKRLVCFLSEILTCKQVYFLTFTCHTFSQMTVLMALTFCHLHGESETHYDTHTGIASYTHQHLLLLIHCCCCSVDTLLLLQSCYFVIAAALLLCYCCSVDALLFLRHCYFLVAAALLHYCGIAKLLLLQRCYIAAALLEEIAANTATKAAWLICPCTNCYMYIYIYI